MLVTCNYAQIDASLIREEVLDGRTYLVAPMASLVEGVLSGNNGSIFYSANEIKSSTPAWNHKPIVVYHPKDGDKFVSAGSKKVMEEMQVGFLLNSRYDTKLRHEAWIDREKAAKVDSRILTALEKKQIMEVSTGLFHDNRITNGVWNGKPYDIEALNFKPDHLALLPDQIGACSVADGAGLLQVNSSSLLNVQKPSRSAFEMKTRNEQVTELIANSAFSESDREWLTSLEDKKFDTISVNTRRLTTNNTAAPVAPAPAPVVAPVAPVVANTTPAPSTLAEVVAGIPEAFRSQIQTALDLQEHQRKELVDSIVANSANSLTANQLSAMPTDVLRGMEKALKAATPAPAAPVTQPVTPAPVTPVNYGGNPAPTTNSTVKREPMNLPNMKFE